ncbi:MAG: GerMN domain-containing protein [Candidatus Levybacteria bacterium]|nr:GerMN domain-containing protein [Candidatus Levybacteria bacterium]
MFDTLNRTSLIVGIITVIVAVVIALGVYKYVFKGSVRQLFTPKTGTKITPTGSPKSLLPTSKPGQQGQAVDKIKLFFVSLDDNGKSGKKIGCGDSIVAVDKKIIPTQEPLKAALEELFSFNNQQAYNKTNLNNALNQSDLRLQDVSINKGGIATVNLLGTQAISGACEDPRIIAQIRETVLQFSSVTDVKMFINGYPIEQLLPGK